MKNEQIQSSVEFVQVWSVEFGVWSCGAAEPLEYRTLRFLGGSCVVIGISHDRISEMSC